MEKNKDLVKEAQMIVNDYVNRKRIEKLALEQKIYSSFRDNKIKSRNKQNKKIKTTLNYVIIMLSLILINLVIYLFTK